MKKYLFLIFLLVGVFIFYGNNVLAAIECNDFSGSGDPSFHKIPCEKIGCVFYNDRCETQRYNFCRVFNKTGCGTNGAACCEWNNLPSPIFDTNCLPKSSASSCSYVNAPVAPTGACTNITNVTLCLLRPNDCEWINTSSDPYLLNGPYCFTKTAPTSCDQIPCTPANHSACDNSSLGCVANHAVLVCACMAKPTPVPPPTAAITKDADLSGVSFSNPTISGTFDAGVEISASDVCSPFTFTTVQYKIDNGATTPLPSSCWVIKTAGKCPESHCDNTSCGDGKCNSLCGENLNNCSEDCGGSQVMFFDKILSIFRSFIKISELIDNVERSGANIAIAATTCSECTVNQYQFNSGCSISTTGLSSGSHTLNLIFKTNSSIKSSYTKSFIFLVGSTAECNTTQSNANGSNNACVTKYGAGSGKICCIDFDANNRGAGYCDHCAAPDCDTNDNSPTNGNKNCLAKYGLAKSCCHEIVRNQPAGICEKCGGGGPTPTPTIDIKANGSDGPISISPGSSATLTWASANVTACTASGAWSDSKSTSGSQLTGELTSPKTYTITCTGVGGSASDSVIVNSSALILELSSVFSGQNITKSGKAGAKITASPGDLIKYSVKVTSIGKNEVKNTLVKASSISGKVIFQDGSLAVDGQKISGDFFGRGLDIGTLAAGQSKTVSFETMVATQSQFTPSSQETLTSSVVVQGVGVMAKTSSVSLTVGAGKVVSEMSLDMNARNITQNTALSRNLVANPGDTVEFRLVALSTGEGVASGVKIADSLPSAFEYILGTTKIDGSFAADGIAGSGISLGNLERNSSRVVVFSAKVSESYEYSIGENYFQNIGKLSASNVNAMTAYLDVKVIREAISDSKMSVGVRLADSAQFFYSRSLSASPGQQVEFAVKITATGEADLNNVVLKSNLPSRLTYVKGSSSIDDQKVDDSIISGLSVGNVALGSYKIVTFHAIVGGSSSFNYGNTALINELVMTANGVDATVREVIVNVNRYKPQAIPSPSLELMAYNETQGQDATTVFSKSGDVIWLVMLVKNNYSTAISNYEIKNDISDLLKIGSVTSIGGGTLTAGQLSYPASIIPPESTISKELKIKINEAGKWNDVLQVFNTFGNTAVINLEKSIVVPEPKIEVIKRIINSTWANGTEVSVEARPNDQLEFIVEVTNTSPVMVGDVKVVENLPPKLTYVSGDASASYNSLTGEVLWELGALIPGEKKELRLLASVSSDAFIPSEFALISRAEASNGINNISFDSNEVKAGISGFLNPYNNWIKIIGGAVALILLVIFGYILYKRFIKKRDTNEYLPLGKN